MLGAPLALVLTAWSAPARLPLAVVPLVMSGPEGALSEVQAGVLEACAYRADLAPMREEEAFALGSLSARIDDCGDDDACVATRLSDIGARLGLLIVVNRDHDHLGVDLIDATSGAAIGQHVGPYPSEPLATFIRARAEVLFEAAGYPRWAELRVRVEPPQASVTVSAVGAAEPPSAIRSDALLPLMPGAYSLFAAHEGFEARTLDVTLKRGETFDASLTLEPDEPIWSSPWLWIGVSGAVIAGVVTGAALASMGGARTICVTKVEGDTCASP